jgi:hypothetical protein
VATLHLGLKLDRWLAVADEIQRGSCDLQKLTLTMFEFELASSVATETAAEAVKEIASAIRQDRNLKCLELRMDNSFTDEAGVALAEALTVNETLQKVVLVDARSISPRRRNAATFGVPAYEAFSAILRVNTSLKLKLPPLGTAGGDQRVRESHVQMCIERHLNKAGRGKLLASSQSTRGAWVDALQKLNATTVDSTPAFQVSCMYSLLRLKPPAWMFSPSDTSNSGVQILVSTHSTHY